MGLLSSSSSSSSFLALFFPLSFLLSRIVPPNYDNNCIDKLSTTAERNVVRPHVPCFGVIKLTPVNIITQSFQFSLIQSLCHLFDRADWVGVSDKHVGIELQVWACKAERMLLVPHYGCTRVFGASWGIAPYLWWWMKSSSDRQMRRKPWRCGFCIQFNGLSPPTFPHPLSLVTSFAQANSHKG